MTEEEKKLVAAIKARLCEELSEWLGIFAPDEDTDEYDEWQLRIARIEAIHTLDDVYYYAEAYVRDSDEFLLGWGL